MNINFKKSSAAIAEIAKKRKEDNAVFYDSNLRELINDKDIKETVISQESLDTGCEYYIFTETEYKLVKFRDLTFGTGKASSEDDFVKVSNVCFYYSDFSLCGFSNIFFHNCTFVGCNFNECYTLGLNAVFDGCSFTSRIPGKKSIDDMPTLFNSCEFSFKFRDCDLSQTVLDKCNFYFSYFGNVNMYDAIFLDCSIDTTKFSGCDLRSAKIINPKFIEFYIEDIDKRSKVNRSTFLGAINYNRNEIREVKYAADVYGIFGELFENNKLMDLSGEYFYLNKLTEHRILKGYDKVKSLLGLITCGYGERPFNSLLASLILVVICGTLYMFFGVNYNNEILVFHPTLTSLLPPPDKLILWYHFSLVTFSTVGYGNVTPIGGSLVVSAVEMVLGVIMVGIWVSTLVRKMVR